MRKLFTLMVLITTLFVSCTSSYKLSDTEFKNSEYSTNGRAILKNGTEVGQVTGLEYELYRGKMVKEISVTLKGLNTEDIVAIIKYLHTKYPNDKIEVNTDNYDFVND